MHGTVVQCEGTLVVFALAHGRVPVRALKQLLLRRGHRFLLTAEKAGAQRNGRQHAHGGKCRPDRMPSQRFVAKRFRRRTELVSASANGTDVSRPACVIAKHLAEQADALGHRLFVDDGRRPDHLHQLVEANDAIPALDQAGDQLEAEAGHVERPVATFDPLARQVDREIEQPVAGRHGR